MAKKLSGVRWKGDGSGYLPGVPTRDMTADEWNELPEQARRDALLSGLYEPGADVELPDVQAAAQNAPAQECESCQ